MQYDDYDPDINCGENGSVYKYVPYFDNEPEFHAWLVKFFESKGWSALSEQSPHYSDYRADIIVQDPISTNWVGLEIKHFNSKRCGSKHSRALEQITQQYGGRNYWFGEKIDAWCYVPYVSNLRGKIDRGDMHLLREMFCYFGIGFLNLNRRSAVLNFAASDKSKKVFVGYWPLAKKKQGYQESQSDEYPTDWELILEKSRDKQSRLK